jgi:hypothetical protein
MARAYGSSAHLLMKRETAYGQAATGNYIRMPFDRCNLGSEQGLIDDPVLGQGRDPLAPLQDVITDDGDIIVPVDPRYLGLWLSGVFGDPDTTDNGDGSFDHEFASGGEDLPSYSIEVGMPKVPAFFVHAGVKLNSIAREFTRSGAAGCDPQRQRPGRDPVRHDAGRDADQPDGLIEGADPTIAALTRKVDVRSADTTLIDLAAGGTSVDLEFACTLSALAELVLTAHEVYLPKPTRSRARAACRPASTSAARRTPPRGAC